jgi:hypothetical protein
MDRKSCVDYKRNAGSRAFDVHKDGEVPLEKTTSTIPAHLLIHAIIALACSSNGFVRTASEKRYG